MNIAMRGIVRGLKGRLVIEKGGPGSGHRGHAGRPGQRGGSVTGAGGISYIRGPVTGLSGVKDLKLFSKSVVSYKPPAGVEEEEIRSVYQYADERLDNMLGEGLDDDYLCASRKTRSEIKQQISGKLADESGIDEEEITDCIDRWAITSNDDDVRALDMQLAASVEFDVPLSDWQYTKLKAAKIRPYDFSTGEEQSYASAASTEKRAVVRAMYDITQRELAAAGYRPNDTVTLFRGITGIAPNLSGNINYKGNAIESWTTSPTIAKAFRSGKANIGAYILAAKVPVRNILCTSRTGFGCITEGEIVVFGSQPNSVVTILEQ